MNKDDSNKNDINLCNFINSAIESSVVDSGSYKEDNKLFLDSYNSELYGDEEEGLSRYVSTDTSDTVDSDMVSMARVFLGGGAPVEFKPVNGGKDAVLESEEMNQYVSWLIANCKDSYKKQIDWLKEIDLQKAGFIEYGIETVKKPSTVVYRGLDKLEFQIKLDALKDEKGVESVEIEEEIELKDGESSFDFKVKLVRERQEFYIRNVPWEDMLIPKGIQSKYDGPYFGKRFRKTRGELLAYGFDKDVIGKLPKSSGETNDVKLDRFREQGGDERSIADMQWSLEEVSGVDLYAMYDYDDDGIAEWRHVIKSGSYVLENKPFDHIPYAGCSAIQMPHSLIGRSRGELACRQQRINTVLGRNLFDNQTAVSMGRTFIDEKLVNTDDFLSAHKNGMIRVKGAPMNSVLPEPVPYTGDKTLMTIQYMDSVFTKSTGNMITNQALTSDRLNEETATRFKGVEAAATGKIELVCRNIAEIAYRDLYEGAAWMAKHFQDSEQEIYVLGKQLSVDPSSWRFEHNVQTLVGSGGDDKEIETLSSILEVQEREQAKGSPLVDNDKKYNTIKAILRTSGINSVQKYFNDPSQPEQVIVQQNEAMQQQIQQMQQQMEVMGQQLQQSNMLADAEKIKQQTALATTSIKKQEADQKDQISVAKLNEDKRQFNISTAQKGQQSEVNSTIELTKLELQNGRDVPGSIV